MTKKLNFLIILNLGQNFYLTNSPVSFFLSKYNKPVFNTDSSNSKWLQSTLQLAARPESIQLKKEFSFFFFELLKPFTRGLTTCLKLKRF